MSFAQAVGQGVDDFRSESQRRRLAGKGYRNILRSALCIALLVPGLAAAFDATYLYDANHRLVGVLNSAGNSTRYVYDDVGNLIRTDSLPPSQFAILGFSPEHGAPGTPVSIIGQGFSTTAASNTVKFNGTVATVVSSDANQVQTTVPAGATTGLISVAVGSNTANTATPFAVDGTGLAPTLTSVAPGSGSAGTTVTLSGTHLNPLPGATTVTLNSTPVVLTTISDTGLTFKTPSIFGSGHFVVTTPYGQATAGPDFVSLATDFGISPISTGRIVVDGAATPLSYSGSDGKVYQLLFDASQGDWLTLQIPNPNSATSPHFALYNPKGQQIAFDSVSSSFPSYHLRQLGQTGTYSIAIQQVGSASNFSAALERDTVITPASTYTLSTNLPGQSKRVVFYESQGQSYGVGLTGVTFNPTSYALDLEGFDRDGLSLGQTNCFDYETPPVCGYAFPAFAKTDGSGASVAEAGWRQFVMTSEQQNTSSATVKLVPDLSGTTTIGATNSIAFSTVGQNAEQTFSAVAGMRLSLSVESLSTTPSSETVDYQIFDPDGMQVFEGNVSNPYLFNLDPLAKSGTYTVFTAPYSGAVGSTSYRLLQDVMATATVNGAAVQVSTEAGQQAAYVAFQGVAGSSYTINCSAPVSYIASSATGPNGSSAGNGGYCGTSSSPLQISNAPATGTYLIRLSNSNDPFNATVTVTSP